MKILNAIKIFLPSLFLCCSLSYAGTLTPADAAIVADINAKVAADKTTSGLKVSITSHDGVVTLTGHVNTDTEVDKLIQIAESNPDVKDVETNQLKIKKSKHTMSDITITAKVKAMYVKEKLFGDKDISVMGVSVETVNGVVFLTGAVENQMEADNAVKYAKSVEGVKSVDSKLEVKPAS